MKNRYVCRSRISEAKFRELLRYFSLDLEANKIAALTKSSSESFFTRKGVKFGVFAVYYYTDFFIFIMSKKFAYFFRCFNQ